jgi:hypothetical protein
MQEVAVGRSRQVGIAIAERLSVYCAGTVPGSDRARGPIETPRCTSVKVHAELSLYCGPSRDVLHLGWDQFDADLGCLSLRRTIA